MIVLVIPAKGMSERVPNKNLRKLGGVSLVRRACLRGLATRLVDRVYLDTESEEIRCECRDLMAQGLCMLDRPAELATNDTNGNDLMVWELGAVGPCEILCQTFATAPLLRCETIDACLERFLGLREYDSFFTAAPVRSYFWTNGRTPTPLNHNPTLLPNSQDLPVWYEETHGLYGIRAEALRECRTRIGRRPVMMRIPKREALDIDDMDDLWMAERLLG